MKTYKVFASLIAIMLIAGMASSQTINWSEPQNAQRHVIGVSIGLEHGAVFGVSYGYRIHSRLFPMVAGAEFSFPSGNNFLDDYKVKIGGKIRWFAFEDFQFSTNIYGVFRRYENAYATLVNFGSDFTGVFGYYRPHWFMAGEVGFDKAIVTHFEHSPIYHEQYPDVVDGWYEPSTGGNFYYGVQTGVSLGMHDIYVRAGKILTQDFKTAPTLPFYGQLGYNVRF